MIHFSFIYVNFTSINIFIEIFDRFILLKIICVNCCFIFWVFSFNFLFPFFNFIYLIFNFTSSHVFRKNSCNRFYVFFIFLWFYIFQSFYLFYFLNFNCFYLFFKCFLACSIILLESAGNISSPIKIFIFINFTWR